MCVYKKIDASILRGLGLVQSIDVTLDDLPTWADY